MLNTLVHNRSVHKGSQSVLFVPSVVKDPLQTLVNPKVVCKGAVPTPRVQRNTHLAECQIYQLVYL